ncbi:unnamed protein product [Dicrocoelium dendriticum]|nr:unnamed protein product [Dicrocoelium dendriticum]
MWNWRDLLISCEYDGRPCELDEEPVIIPTAIMPAKAEMSDFLSDYSNYPRLVQEVSSKQGGLPSTWPGEMPDPNMMNYEPPPWERGKVYLMDHPTKYLCFQVSDALVYLTS